MDAYHKKSLLLKKLEKPEESSELLDKAKTLWRQWEENKVKNAEELYKIRYDIAFRLLMEGKYQESVECFDGLLNIKPNDATVLSNKGIAFLAISESCSALSTAVYAAQLITVFIFLSLKKTSS